MSMRSLLLPVWALLILAGCGRNAADPPTAAIKGSKEGANPDANKKDIPEGKKDATVPEVKKPVATEPKKEDLPVARDPAFDPNDVQRTLHWLTASLVKVRALSPDDPTAVDREWAN